MRLPKVLYLLPFLILVFSCDSKETNKEVKKEEKPRLVIKVPDFKADSAFAYIQKQVDFGPRVPGTKNHEETGDYLVAKLKGFGAEITEQEFEAETWDGQRVPLRNIIASFFPEAKKRILLAAHWDTRPYSDKDPVSPEIPMIGANDGASGVGVLLEIARNLQLQAPADIGVDIILFDGEDWGEKAGQREYIPTPKGYESWWCLGSQYWSRNKHSPNYSAFYGILLDMVGGRGAQFHIEGISNKYAPRIVERVWDQAEDLGYGRVFVRDYQAEIIDDHLYVNQIAKVPMVNIVPYNESEGYFGSFHHTQKDNMELIDKQILEIVGETVQHVLYYESTYQK